MLLLPGFIRPRSVTLLSKRWVMQENNLFQSLVRGRYGPVTTAFSTTAPFLEIETKQYTTSSTRFPRNVETVIPGLVRRLKSVWKYSTIGAWTISNRGIEREDL